MARPENPISTSNKALGELQQWLRERRDRTGQGYRALAVRAGCHATTLQRAASGERVPKWGPVLNYASACGASIEEVRALWKLARYEETRLARGKRNPVPPPKRICDEVELSAALQDLYEKAGSPALRALEERAGSHGILPRSTAYRIVTKQTVPRHLHSLRAYLKACEAPEKEWPVWEAAWLRAQIQETQDNIAVQKAANATPKELKVDAPGASTRLPFSPESTAAAEFTGLYRWPVVPGAQVRADVCSCGRPDCGAPGAHPLDFAPVIPAGSTLAEVAAAWAEFPDAPVMLPVGRTFDVIEMAERAGRRAVVRLERMGLPLGPVAVTPDGRAQFFVAPGAAEELPELLYRMGWDNLKALDLQGVGPGAYITAPPFDRGGRGPVRWLHQPALDSLAPPPQARLLLGTLAYMAHRSRQ